MIQFSGLLGTMDNNTKNDFTLPSGNYKFKKEIFKYSPKSNTDKKGRLEM